MWSSGLSRRLLQGLQGCSDQDTTERQNMKSRKPLQRYVHIITTKHLQMDALFVQPWFHALCLVLLTGCSGWQGCLYGYWWHTQQQPEFMDWEWRNGWVWSHFPMCLWSGKKIDRHALLLKTLGSVRLFVVVVWNFIFIEGIFFTNPTFFNGRALYIKLILYLSTASQFSNDLQLSLFR